MKRQLLAVVAVCACSLSLSACGSSNPTPQPSASTAATNSDHTPSDAKTQNKNDAGSTVTSETPATATEMTPINADFVTPPLHGNGFPELKTSRSITAIRVGEHEGYSRLVIEYSAARANTDTKLLPGYDIKYVAAARSMGKGDVIQVPGAAVLDIHLSGISEPVNMSLPSPYEKIGAAGIILGGTALMPFEGMAQLVIGVKREAPLRVFEMNNPARLVIDFK